MRAFAALAFCLFASTASANETVSFQDLQPGQTIEIRTSDRVYRAQLINCSTGESLATASWDGVNFSQPRTIYLLGATSGPNAQASGLMVVRMHEIKTGLCVEMGVDGMNETQRHVTTPVESVRVL